MEHAADQVLEGCVDLDPVDGGRSTAPVGWPVGVGRTDRRPVHARASILVEEERILSLALDAQPTSRPRRPRSTTDGLDVLQADAAAAVAGQDRLVVVVGPAGAGKTTMLARAVDDLERPGRLVFGVAPTAKAAQVLGHETGMSTDTLAKLLHEWTRPDRPPLDRYRLAAGATVIVDEAGMLGTNSLARLVDLAEAQGWRLVLVGDPRQLQAVGRGGMFAELCTTGRVHELARLHRFTHPWEAAASLRLRAGDPTVLDVYESHGRITAGSFDDHLHRLADAVADGRRGRPDDRHHRVDQRSRRRAQRRHPAARLAAGHLDPDRAVAIGGRGVRPRR